MAQLPTDRTKLAIAQANQTPGLVADATANKNALTEAYDTLDLLYQFVNQVLQGIYDSGKFTKLGIVNVTDAPFNAKGDGITDNAVQIQNCINANNGAIVFFPPGTFNISNSVTITNDVCLILSPGTTIKATTAMDDMIVYNNGNTNGGKNRFIQGGILDGNGLAKNCLNIPLCAHLIVQDMLFKNPINRGIKNSGGYELICRNLFFNNTLTTNIADNIAMEISTSDAIIDTFVMTNFTVGILVTQAGNYFSNGHIWGGQTGRFNNTVGIINRALANHFDKIYFDTRAIGMDTTYRTYLTNCLFVDGGELRSSLFPTNVINILIGSTVYVTIDNCYFECKSGDLAYRSTVVSGSVKFAQFKNCDFATPSVQDNVPLNNRTPNIFRFRLTFSGWGTIAANSTSEKEITVSDPNFTVDFRDLVIINPNGSWELGIVPSPIVKDNTIGIRLSNVKTTGVAVADRQVFVTIIKDAARNYYPYSIIS